ncbi:splicing factor, arginine/serine-rich 19 [Drosophila elegans]|uniref:splicing factor, arginine/serine-rich 19 n=1 Tax=Drosophila elegans TaxID=30023 RepID=UPI0007E60889|nr:splicing factor, arginine/serine-rich 19 [Drosophila elegans]
MEMDAELTNRAIAELMREIEGQNPSLPSHKQAERKVNPLGKTNKRFLGRTINTAIRHNKREDERTQANCRQKLQDLDDIYERRQSNHFYNRDVQRSRSRSRSRSLDRNGSRVAHKKDKRRGSSRRRSSSSSSRESSRSRSRSRHSRSRRRKKHKKKAKKHKKSTRRRRKSSRSSSSSSRSSRHGEAMPIAPPSEMFLQHSKQMAAAVAMVYGQVFLANGQKLAKERSASPLSDIVRELMSDDEEPEKSRKTPIALTCSSSDEGPHLLTIDVSSNSSAECLDTDSDGEDSAGSCINLDESESENDSDMELIECHDEQPKEMAFTSASASAPETETCNEKQQVDVPTTVDLTED